MIILLYSHSPLAFDFDLLGGVLRIARQMLHDGAQKFPKRCLLVAGAGESSGKAAGDGVLLSANRHDAVRARVGERVGDGSRDRAAPRRAHSEHEHCKQVSLSAKPVVIPHRRSERHRGEY